MIHLRSVRSLTAVVAGGAVCAPILSGLAGGAESTPITFSKDIAPILLAKCVGCHGPEKSKGGYRLHTFEALMQAGESKDPTVVAGQPNQSKLFQLITAKDADDRMPQKDDPLPSAQITLIERWIKEGAIFDGPDPKATLAMLVPQLPHPDPPDTYSHPVPIRALAFSPDGKELAAGGYYEITTWNPLDGSLLRRIKNVPQQVMALSYNPTGTLLAVAGGAPGKSGEVKLIDLAGGRVTNTLVITPDLVLTLAFDSEGKRLAVGGTDNTIRFFEIVNGKQQFSIEQHADWVMSLAFSPDGTQLASASRDKTARLFDTKTGELEQTYPGHTDPVFAAAFSADGKLVLSSGRDKEVHVWQAKDAKKIFEITGFDAEVLRLSAHRDQLFSCCADKQVRQHQLGEKKAELVRTFSGHRDVVYALAYHEPTKRLASGSFDGEVRVWDAGNGNLLTNFLAAPGYRITDGHIPESSSPRR